jgi:hypothetical protein
MHQEQQANSGNKDAQVGKEYAKNKQGQTMRQHYCPIHQQVLFSSVKP